MLTTAHEGPSRDLSVERDQLSFPRIQGVLIVGAGAMIEQIGIALVSQEHLQVSTKLNNQSSSNLLNRFLDLFVFCAAHSRFVRVNASTLTTTSRSLWDASQPWFLCSWHHSPYGWCSEIKIRTLRKRYGIIISEGQIN